MKTNILCLLLLVSTLVKPDEISMVSAETQTQLIELYTSEGCSSCPPADRWLSSLKSDPDLFKQFIPVAFHVGYWDYIGWKDELALIENATRQRLHKKVKNLSSVYTPGVIIAGKEWRSWRAAKIQPSSQVVGRLILKLIDNNLTAKFDGEEGKFKLNVALLGMDIETTVRAGENQGKVLRHNFVLLKQQVYLSDTNTWQIELDQDFLQSQYKNRAFVAWIEKPNNPAPIQAVGTML